MVALNKFDDERLMSKVFRVANSCDTPDQLRSLLRYLRLAKSAFRWRGLSDPVIDALINDTHILLRKIQ